MFAMTGELRTTQEPLCIPHCNAPTISADVLHRRDRHIELLRKGLVTEFVMLMERPHQLDFVVGECRFRMFLATSVSHVAKTCT